jgi:hypothetical protein
MADNETKDIPEHLLRDNEHSDSKVPILPAGYM